jgi:hypothetical protein
VSDERNMNAMEQGEPVETQARDRMVHGLLVTRHELPIDRQRRIQGLMQRVQRESLRNAPWRRVVRHLGGLAAVAAVLQRAPAQLPWKQLTDGQGPQLASFEAEGPDGHLYSLNALDGTVLLDGAPPGRLRADIRQMPLYRLTF